ncbi:MATE family efflux transporter [Rhizobium sp. KVB221]|uniref:MATE family efflux transporter n=1 Tax=Rhizobium setariae TaxID=2801340 RepID=A0A936YS50_9HYPH|nr:MATE family efflux transporter [Rhizobium setariae]MBL0371851.1 MATE family efflux transporter [Rhizobium setariae]
MDARSSGAFEVTHRMVLGLALPMTFGFLTIPLLGITDTGVAGRLGDPAILAGLAIGSVLFDLIFATFNFLRASTTALVAQAWGRGDREEQEAVFWRALLLSLALGLGVAALSPFLLKAGLLLMAPEESAADATSHWFTIRVLSAPAGLANYAILGFLLGRGQARIGLLLQALINGINIVLSIFLGLTLQWGISGIAFATITGETIGALAGLAIILARFRHRNPLAVAGLLDRQRLMQLFSLNTDIMIRSFVLLAAFFLMTRIGTGFGPVTLAANAVLMNFFMIAGFWLDGLANAAETIIGRSIGAHWRPAFDRGLKLTGYWSLVLAIFTTLGLLAIGRPAIDFLTTVESVRVVAYDHLGWAAITAVSGCLAFLMDGVFIGATWSHAMRNRMILAFAGYCVALAVLVPLAGNTGLWISLNVFLILRGILLAVRVPALRDQIFRPAQ